MYNSRDGLMKAWQSSIVISVWIQSNVLFHLTQEPTNQLSMSIASMFAFSSGSWFWWPFHLDSN